MTARRMRVCAPQRQRLPPSACFACSSVGRGARARSALVVMIMPLVQYPHCAACSAMNAACTRSGRSGVPSTSDRGDVQARRAADRQDTRTLGATVDEHRAGTALAEPAAELRPVQSERTTQCIEQRLRRIPGRMVRAVPLTRSWTLGIEVH